VHPDTIYSETFSDVYWRGRIKTITIFHNFQLIHGVRIRYHIKDQILEKWINPGGYSKDVFVEINLEEGENVVELGGACGDLIDSLKIATSLGKVFIVGGEGGAIFQNLMPTGSSLVGISGGGTFFLHNICVYYR
jgi:hypothetical protein